MQGPREEVVVRRRLDIKKNAPDFLRCVAGLLDSPKPLWNTLPCIITFPERVVFAMSRLLLLLLPPYPATCIFSPLWKSVWFCESVILGSIGKCLWVTYDPRWSLCAIWEAWFHSISVVEHSPCAGHWPWCWECRLKRTQSFCLTSST